MARPRRPGWPRRIEQADIHLFRRISHVFHPFGDPLLPKLSRAANHSRLWGAIALTMALFGGRYGRRAGMRGMVAIALSSFLTNLPAKLLFRRARPQDEVPLARRLARLPTSTSFPSGHAASAFAFATGVTLEKPTLAPVVFPLAGAVAYSRIYTGVHYPSDVLVGGAIGSGLALATQRLWPLVPDEPAWTPPVGGSVADLVDTDGRGLVVVVNPSAGMPIGDVAETLRAGLPSAEIVEVSEGEDLLEALGYAGDTGDVIGIAGGDGSVNAAAAVALERDKPLLVVPAGTLNHFARDLGIETVADALRAVTKGVAAQVDVASIAGEVFVNTASIGAYVDLVEAREGLEEPIGKWPAALVALGRILRHGEPVPLEIDGEPVEAWMVFFGNCRYTPDGFTPTARRNLSDGAIDVRIVEGSHPLSRTRLLWAVLTGTLSRSRVYRGTITDHPILVRVQEESVCLARDGETFEGPTEFTVEKAGSLKLLIPADKAEP